MKKKPIKKLTKKEIEKLEKVLKLFEEETRKETGVRRLSGGFASVNMSDFHDETIDIEVNWGCKSDCTDNVHTEQWTLDRKELSSKKTIQEIVDCIDSQKGE
jgi:hypothetical protein